MSFDLAVTVKAAAPELNDGLSRMGAAISGSSDAQVRLVEIPGTEALCQSGASASVEAAANLRLGAHDVVDLSRLRIDFDLLDIRYPFESDVGVCYGTHTAVGGWTWSAGLLPIVFDSPWVYGGPDGTAHIDFPVDAKHVDSVVVVYNERVRGLFLKRITYWATGSR